MRAIEAMTLGDIAFWIEAVVALGKERDEAAEARRAREKKHGR